MLHQSPWLTAVPCLLLAWVTPASAAAVPDPPPAIEAAASAGIQGGLVIHVECGDGTLTARLAEGGRFIVHGLGSDRAGVTKAQARLEAQKLLGAANVEYSPVGRFDLKTGALADKTPFEARGITLFNWTYATFAQVHRTPLAYDTPFVYSARKKPREIWKATVAVVARAAKAGEKAPDAWAVGVPAPGRIESVIKAGDQVLAAVSLNKPDQGGGEVWVLAAKDAFVCPPFCAPACRS